MFSSNRLSQLESTQQEIRRQLDTIVTALIVSEPRTAIAAEAFDGLRRNVAFAAQERRRQLIQLVTFADAIERGATIDTLRELSEQWCAEAGVARYHDAAAKPDWFTVINGDGDGDGDGGHGDGDGGELEVVEPAWVEAANTVLLRQGTARRRPTVPAATEPTATEPTATAGPVATGEPVAAAEPVAEPADSDEPDAAAGDPAAAPTARPEEAR